VEVDGSELLDPTAGRLVPAVVVRLPGHRAQWLGLVLSAYTRVCQLVGTEVDAAEAPMGWALRAAAVASGDRAVEQPALARVTSGQRMRAAAALREREDFDDVTLIAVVDAAARWMDEPDGGAVRVRAAGRGDRSGDAGLGVPGARGPAPARWSAVTAEADAAYLRAFGKQVRGVGDRGVVAGAARGRGWRDT
jgi:hypothetical protein